MAELKLLTLLLLIFPISYCKLHQIEPFVSQATRVIVICDPHSENEEVLEEIIDISAKKEIWMNHWDCYNSDIPKTTESLIILNGIEPSIFKDILVRPRIQLSLAYNTWVIIAKGKTSAYFEQRNLKIGLNANIFIVSRTILGYEVVQVSGTGTYDSKFKVRRYLN